MKLFILFFVQLVSPMTLCAQQDASSFSVEDGMLVWRKVYNTRLTSQQILEHFSNIGLIRKIKHDSSKITGDIRELDFEVKGAGYSKMEVPIYVSSSRVEAFVLIEVRNGRYRVTVRRIFLVQAIELPVSKIGERTEIEEYAVKHSKLTSGFEKTPSKILEFTLNKLFDLGEADEKEW